MADNIIDLASIQPPSEGRADAVRIDLTDADMDDWRDAVVFGKGPLGAYTPDPEATATAAAAIPATAPCPPIQIMHRRPDRTVQAVRLILLASAAICGAGQLWTAWS